MLELINYGNVLENEIKHFAYADVGLLDSSAHMSPMLAALIPIAIACVAFEVFCLADVWQAGEVRYLPRWTWTVICLISIPLGGLVYLALGRVR